MSVIERSSNDHNGDDNCADFLLWMLADSALPTGGFVSSNGLEAALQCGHVLPTAASLSRFLLQNLLNLASSTFPYMRALYNFCHSSYNNSNHNTALDLLSALARLDSDYDAVISMNHVARRASQAQGVALLTLLSKDIFQISLEHREVCLKFKQLVRKGDCAGHYPICFTLLCLIVKNTPHGTISSSSSTSQPGILITRHKMLKLFLFLNIRAIISSAVRLNIVGPYEGQSILARSQVAVVDRVLRLNTPEPPNLFAGLDLLENNDNITSNIFIQSNQSSPVLDIMQGLHDRLYSKMFNS